ncbi:MAG TPA: hypothetical protein VJ739_02130 [Gemmataceae bacterium]|nr:hypothetical protein [Gemmataceae bacterium]
MPAWVPLWALLLACLYLPTLGTRFDFIDDGNLVYPAPPMPLGQRLGLVWEKVVANYEHLGPFRPVLWVHWEAEAELFRANPVAWRAGRLLWAALAAGMLLWLLHELGVRPGAAVLAAALATWEPYRGEIWTSLTLSEGVAMPYALLALVCAVRAARSPRPWRWDLAGSLGLLAALGCKNTFAALVPAQLLLRLLADGRAPLAAWQAHGRRACLLTLPLLMPIIHFILFKLAWHPGQYTTGLSLAQAGRMLRTVGGALSPAFVGPGLVVVALVVGVSRWRGPAVPGTWERYRLACLAAAALLLFGIGIYLPLDAVSGRYSMPAVWGGDILVGVLLSALAGVQWPAWRRVGYAAFGCGLVAVAVASLGKQEKFAARARLLWRTLDYVARQAPPHACIGWASGPALNPEEGIHFRWHLLARGRGDLGVCLLDEDGHPLQRREVPAAVAAPSLLVSGSADRPPGGPWQSVRDFRAFYWAGRRRYDCYLWQLRP